ncbi:MAG: amino acid dehydrogenase [Sphingobacteriales bacterium]|nr:MAG: amino acid dehydrogenase [Sphingobacteriales bacterium]
MQVKELIKKFENKAPEIVFEWNDAETGAQGWIVINSLRGGAAGGGTRMRKGLDKNEVLSLAKTMEIKFAVSGPEIGGAKSGINFNPADPRKLEVLDRWYKAVIPVLKAYYGTGGDLNIDEIKEVIPITEKYGLQHPQEGVLVGHFSPSPEVRTQKINQLRQGVSLRITDQKYTPDVNRHYVVADMITGWGVSESIFHYYTIWKKQSLQGKRVIIQGWGNVAAAAAFFLAQAGAKIVGIIDRNGGIVNDGGLGFEEITRLFNDRVDNELKSPQVIPFSEVNSKIWDVKADIFVPAAASRIVDQDALERMQKAGVEVISSGANVPFKDPDIFFGPTAEFADKHFTVIPDFIANCGMARTFAYLMESGIVVTDEAIFEDVSNIMKVSLEKLYGQHNQEKGLTEAAFKMVLEKIMPGANNE